MWCRPKESVLLCELKEYSHRFRVSKEMDQQSQLHHLDPRLAKGASGQSSRILYDIPCKVCQDHSSGKHYGIFACDGCAGFFKRSIRRARQYVCKAKSEGGCIVDKTHRNQCRACRLNKCVQAGMNKDAVQHERGPRNSTLRRQMALYFKEPDSPTHSDVMSQSRHQTHHVLDLAMPKTSHRPQPPPPHLLHPATFLCARPPDMPFSLSATPGAETLCEAAARLLFMNVQWAKSVPAFTGLHYSDQLLLLEASWRELFVLGAAQFLLPLELGVRGLLTRQEGLLTELRTFQDTLTKFEALSVDPHEYACLRAIVLFKTAFEGSSSTVSSSSSESPSGTDVKTLRDATAVAALQDHTQLTLNKYISTAHPAQPFRFGKLLLLLPALKAVSAATIEELFFRRTIGHIPIERIICDMYKATDL